MELYFEGWMMLCVGDGDRAHTAFGVVFVSYGYRRIDHIVFDSKVSGQIERQVKTTMQGSTNMYPPSSPSLVLKLYPRTPRPGCGTTCRGPWGCSPWQRSCSGATWWYCWRL